MSASILDRYCSPISRHPTEGWFHWLTYSIHDLSSIAFLAALVGRPWMNLPWLVPMLLASSLVSGTALIAYRWRKGSSSGHLTSTSVVTSIIVNQGMAMAYLGWSLFASEQPAGWNAALLAGVISAHALYSAARAARFFVAHCGTRGGFSETTMQLSYMVAMPNMVFFAAYAAGYWLPADKSLLLTLVVYEGVVGLAFSIAHDRTWLWGSRGICRWQREMICMLPYGWLVAGLL